MFLENLVFDAADPQRLGRFCEALVDGEQLTDDVGIYETRLDLGDWYLDLCFQQVDDPGPEPSRLHVDLLPGARAVEATDPEGNPVGVAPDDDPATGPIAALTLDSADPARDAGFWAWLTGWDPDDDGTLRHPSGRGPVLRFRPEPAPKGPAKNRIHPDLRLEAGDDDADAVEAAILARGGRRMSTDWGDLPWRSYLDPSGNEFCVLPAPSAQATVAAPG